MEIVIPKSVLLDLYVGQKMTLREISEALNIDKSRVHKHLSFYDIPRRSSHVKLGQELACENCGKPRYFKRHEIEEYDNHFCSSVCQREWLKRNKVQKICSICGEVFYHPASQRNRNTCSERCKGILSTQIQQKRKGLTKLELRGRSLLNDLEIEFLEQQLIENKFLVDVFIPTCKVVIQWDGRYWHSLPKRKSLDKSQDSYMKRCGYTVLRFTDYDVYKNPDYVKGKIYETLSNQN